MKIAIYKQDQLISHKDLRDIEGNPETEIRQHVEADGYMLQGVFPSPDPKWQYIVHVIDVIQENNIPAKPVSRGGIHGGKLVTQKLPTDRNEGVPAMTALHRKVEQVRNGR